MPAYAATISLSAFLPCFLGENLYDRPLHPGPLAIVLLLLMCGILRYDSTTRIGLVISVFSGGLFACCMFCRGELAARKPSPSHLTALISPSPWAGRSGASLSGGAGGRPRSRPAAPWKRPWRSPPAPPSSSSPISAKGGPPAIAGLVLAAMAAGSGAFLYRPGEKTVAMARNFSGSLRVTRHLPGSGFETRVLLHGTVAHGVQFAAPERRLRPTAYYGPDSGAARLRRGRSGRPLRVGLIGLGVGTPAAYSQPGDADRFHEINPLVEKLAREHFTFLAQAEGFVEVVIGERRLVLEGEETQHFDVLVVDAFSGDAIPPISSRGRPCSSISGT
ncbi:MAG: hypothetical protein WHT06_08580 [Desulfobacterales bacterium]